MHLVVVLYRSRLRQLKGLLGQIRGAELGARVTATVVFNECLAAPSKRVRKATIAGGRIQLEILRHANSNGVAGAYNLAIGRSSPDDVVILLDADTRLDGAFFERVYACRSILRSGLVFIAPDQHASAVRVSPYRLSGLVPVTAASLPEGADLNFSDGWGVINSGLAGTVKSFVRVGGFDGRIGLDLSDVLWSREAARAGARLVVDKVPYQHSLSMLEGGFSAARLRKYLVACWRLGLREKDPWGGARLAIRGLRAWTRA